MSQDQQERLAAGLCSARESSFAAEIASEAERVTVTVRGRLDHDSRPVLALALAKAIAARRGEILVDLEGLESLDPEDVALLVRARSLLRSPGQHLVVRSPATHAEVLAALAPPDARARTDRADGGDAGAFSPTIP